MQIIEGIQEIIMQDTNAPSGGSSGAGITKEAYPWLTPAYLDIAANQESIK